MRNLFKKVAFICRDMRAGFHSLTRKDWLKVAAVELPVIGLLTDAAATLCRHPTILKADLDSLGIAAALAVLAAFSIGAPFIICYAKGHQLRRTHKFKYDLLSQGLPVPHL